MTAIIAAVAIIAAAAIVVLIAAENAAIKAKKAAAEIEIEYIESIIDDITADMTRAIKAHNHDEFNRLYDKRYELECELNKLYTVRAN